MTNILNKLADNGAFPHHVHRLLLWGPPGTGKSSWAIRTFGPENVIRVTIDGDTMAEDLIATRDLSVRNGASETRWTLGPAAQAMRDGKILVLDEIDQASPSLRARLHAICDDRQIACLTLPDGQVIRPAAGYGVVATTNAEPDALPEALLDRFIAVFVGTAPQIDGLAPAYQALLDSRYGRETVCTWTAPVSVRRILQLASLERVLPLEDAAEVIFGRAGADVANMLAVQESAA